MNSTLPVDPLQARCSLGVPVGWVFFYKCLRKNVAIFQASIAFQGNSAVV